MILFDIMTEYWGQDPEEDGDDPAAPPADEVEAPPAAEASSFGQNCSCQQRDLNSPQESLHVTQCMQHAPKGSSSTRDETIRQLELELRDLQNLEIIYMTEYIYNIYNII